MIEATTTAASGAPLNGSLPISVIQGRHVVNVTKPETEGVREFSSDCIDPTRFVLIIILNGLLRIFALIVSLGSFIYVYFRG